MNEQLEIFESELEKLHKKEQIIKKEIGVNVRLTNAEHTTLSNVANSMKWTIEDFLKSSAFYVIEKRIGTQQHRDSPAIEKAKTAPTKKSTTPTKKITTTSVEKENMLFEFLRNHGEQTTVVTSKAFKMKPGTARSALDRLMKYGKVSFRKSGRNIYWKVGDMREECAVARAAVDVQDVINVINDGKEGGKTLHFIRKELETLGKMIDRESLQHIMDKHRYSIFYVVRTIKNSNPRLKPSNVWGLCAKRDAAMDESCNRTNPSKEQPS